LKSTLWWFWWFWVTWGVLGDRVGSTGRVGSGRVIGQVAGQVSGQVGSGLLYMRVAGLVFVRTGRILRQVGLALYVQRHRGGCVALYTEGGRRLAGLMSFG
jgi:hypothetical protein